MLTPQISKKIEQQEDSKFSTDGLSLIDVLRPVCFLLVIVAVRNVQSLVFAWIVLGLIILTIFLTIYKILKLLKTQPQETGVKRYVWKNVIWSVVIFGLALYILLQSSMLFLVNETGL